MDSPETFSSTRRNTTFREGSVSAGAPTLTRSVSQGDALERNDLGALGGKGLADADAGIVDPRLVDEHRVGEEALREHAFDDLAAHLLGLRGDVGLLEEDLPLGFDDRRRDLAPPDVARRRKGDV